MSSNNFSGEVPSTLSNLDQLMYLGLSNNSLEGSVPRLARLVKLEYLSIRSNSFTGPFPNWISNLSQLIGLDLGFNALTGPIPSNLSGLSNLRYLLSPYNFFNGTIPLWVFSLPSLMSLWLESNRLSGQIHEFWSVSLRHVDLRTNELDGPIPTIPTVNYFLSNNKFTREIPSKLCEVTLLEILDLSNNSLSGAIPECLGNFSNVLRVLDLGMNNFHGKITSLFGERNKLRIVRLKSNHFEGPLPRTLENCRHLTVLDIGNNEINDTFPNWLETLPQLQVLVLQSNKFHGHVAPFKAKHPFSKLRILDLSHNEFSGPLPSKYFKHFTAMRTINGKEKKIYMGEMYYKYSVGLVIKGLELEVSRILTILTTIDLSCNKFGGEIPTFLGKLSSLRWLNLSHNGLKGDIPSSLGDLGMLESLDLSSNQLSGEIPSKLTSLTFLEVLNLSNNRLEGRIPQGNQFNTFQRSSYEGNLGLCGAPLSKECGGNKTPKMLGQPMLHKEDDSSFGFRYLWKFLVMGYGCGAVLGLVMGYFVIIKRESKWLVRMVEGRGNRKVKRRSRRRLSNTTNSI